MPYVCRKKTIAIVQGPTFSFINSVEELLLAKVPLFLRRLASKYVYKLFNIMKLFEY